MPSTRLPVFTEAGNPGTWQFTDRHASTVRLDGDFLGMGSSHRPYHKHPYPPYAEKGQHCSTCRWMEQHVFQGLDGRYVVVQRGASIVPGEDEIITFGWADSGDAVVAALTSWGDDGKPSFSFVARRALEQASSYDDGIHTAYRAATERMGS